MALGWATTNWVRSGYTFEIHPLAKSVDSLPIQIEEFEGKDVALDDEIQKILNADAVVNRTYSRSNGDSISVHVSAWFRPESMTYVAPHIPRVCYTNGGWKILEERTVTINTAIGKLPFVTMLVERNGETHVVAFWYQMGSEIFTSASEARRIHRQYWGKKDWPPTVKAMLDTPAADIEAALPRLNAFAALVFAWTSEL